MAGCFKCVSSLFIPWLLFFKYFFIALHYDHFCMVITKNVCYARISMDFRSVALLFKDKTTVSPALFAI